MADPSPAIRPVPPGVDVVDTKEKGPAIANAPGPEFHATVGSDIDIPLDEQVEAYVNLSAARRVPDH